MSLQFNVSDIDSVPEEHRALYSEVESGGFQLQVEGATSKEKLNEFRQNNVKLMKDLEGFKKFDGVDLDEYEALKEESQNIKDKKLLDSGKVDELVENRVSSMKGEYDKQIDDLTGKNNSLHGRLEGLIIDGAAKDAAVAAGVAASAIEDVMYRVRNTFTLSEDKAIPSDRDGNVMYGVDGVTPLSIADWVKDLSKTAPHLFAKSSGSNTPDETSGGGANSITRAEFDAMGAVARMAFAKKGGKVVDS
jgi:hypothetical protein